MNRLVLQTDGRDFVTAGAPVAVSIPLRFDGPQPGFFGADAATARPMHTGEFIGDTRLGGSCNAEHVDFIPHCNGTHTECVGHITNERVSIHKLADCPLYLCALVSVEPVVAAASSERVGLKARQSDRLITRASLDNSVTGDSDLPFDALIVRTLPNDPDKADRQYERPAESPYFTVDAMQWIVRRDFKHLLVDTPSVDRLDDGGHLNAHRIFWGVAPGSRSVNDVSRPDATITELIYVPDELSDGMYLLSLQVAPFVSDAAPSRPLLYRIAE